MYLIIYEDGAIHKATSILDEDLASCDDGTLSVVDISEPDAPKEYFNGEWSVVADTPLYSSDFE